MLLSLALVKVTRLLLVRLMVVLRLRILVSRRRSLFTVCELSLIVARVRLVVTWLYVRMERLTFSRIEEAVIDTSDEFVLAVKKMELVVAKFAMALVFAKIRCAKIALYCAELPEMAWLDGARARTCWDTDNGT